jgi:hypothetical protein
VRTQRYRLDNARRLYDMQLDPGQDHDMAPQQPEVARRLSSAMDRWRAELLTGLGHDSRPYPVGYRQFPVTQLPARDGVPQGNVRRSSAAPNCSYFCNWTSTDDRITWDVEVATAGRYEAQVYYTCPAADVGSTVALSFGDARVQTTVDVAHDPPLYGAEHDRVPRTGESLMKDFRPLRLGVLELKPGRGPLTLQALRVPGKQVMDVRLILLTLLK